MLWWTVNVRKSEFIPVGEALDIRGLPSMVGFKMDAFPITYLGLPFGSTCKALLWDSVIERFERGWQME